MTTVKTLLRRHVRYFSTCHNDSVTHFSKLLQDNKAYDAFSYIQKLEDKNKVKQKTDELYFKNIESIITSHNFIFEQYEGMDSNVLTSGLFSVIGLNCCLFELYDIVILSAGVVFYNVLRSKSRQIYIENEKNKIEALKHTNKFIKSLPF
jgi:hypothetical protein